MKSPRLFSVDAIISQQFSNLVPERQRSQIIESFMRSYIQAQGMGDKEREELELEEKSLETTIGSGLERLAIVKMQLADLARREAQERSERIKNNELVVKSMIHNGILHGDD